MNLNTSLTNILQFLCLHISTHLLTHMTFLNKTLVSLDARKSFT